MNWAVGQHPNIQVMPGTAWIINDITGAFSAFNRGSERGRFLHLSIINYPLKTFLAHVASNVNAIVGDAHDHSQRFYGDYGEKGITLNPENRMHLYRSSDQPTNQNADGSTAHHETHIMHGHSLKFFRRQNSYTTFVSPTMSLFHWKISTRLAPARRP